MKSLALLTLILAACNGCSHPLPPVDPPAPVADSCQTACDNGAAHGWNWSKPTTKGASCVDVCTNAAAFGDSYPTRCLTIAQTADQADGCWSASGQAKP